MEAFKKAKNFNVSSHIWLSSSINSPPPVSHEPVRVGDHDGEKGGQRPEEERGQEVVDPARVSQRLEV